MNTNVDRQTPASNYDFELPRELIAQQPVANREDARLMVIDRARGTIDHAHFRDIVDWVKTDDCLVLNETKVLMAKLVGYRTQTGGRWQGLYLEHDSETGVIKVMCKTRGKIKPGETVTLQDRNGLDRAVVTMVARLGGGCWAIQPQEPVNAMEFLEMLGRVPLPHYIRDGNMTDADVQDYQTVYARNTGSVAAPTAGLHFTDRLLSRILDAGANICKLNLHVGTGTFRPIGTDVIEQHEMHAESGSLDATAAELLQRTRDRGGRIIAVGTTSVRLLETIGQSGALRPWSGATSLYIRPGHQFQLVDAMVTNFHLPRTTLLVLVRTFGGDELMKRAYQEAVDLKYRFFSYGDGMLII